MDNDLRNINQAEQETLDGSPATIHDVAGYTNTKFQLGPIKEHGVNGNHLL